MYFHAGTNQLQQPIVWQGNTYQPLPIESEGFDVSTKGTLPRPKIRVANVGGLLSAEVRQNDDLIGCKLIRKRTFSRYLDDSNFLKTNRLINSLDPASWSTHVEGTGTVTVERIIDSGFGQVARITKTAGANDDQVGITLNLLGLSGNAFNGSVWCKKNTPTTDGYAFSVVATALPSGTNSRSVSVNSEVNVWERLASDSFEKTLVGDAVFSILVKGPIGSSIDIHSPQLSLGTGLKNYSATTARINNSADPNQHFSDDVWYVDRKISENRYLVEWELSSAFDLQGVMLPKRQVIQNSCVWRYRGTECGYTGAPFDKNDQLCGTTDDFCSKRLSSCEVRFHYDGKFILPYGGFPGATRANG